MWASHSPTPEDRGDCRRGDFCGGGAWATAAATCAAAPPLPDSWLSSTSAGDSAAAHSAPASSATTSAAASRSRLLPGFLVGLVRLLAPRMPLPALLLAAHEPHHAQGADAKNDAKDNEYIDCLLLP
mmetsp:Transcript_22410/g.70371  ORF Transcript_22410/g.70371 Transcript_22410/m.70371 type:complete len:127 (-) Transcript_22410:112-492(-)